MTDTQRSINYVLSWGIITVGGSLANDTLLSDFAEIFIKLQEQMSQEEIKNLIKKAESGRNRSYWQGKKRSELSKDFLEFFDKRFPNSKKDLFRNVVYTKDIDQYKDWTAVDNHRKYIESLCADYGLSPTFVDRHLALWSSKKMPELLIDIPDWDGKDHIEEALSRITVTNIDHKYFVELMKDWFSKIVRRVYQPKVQNRLPVFRGKQGLGKDFSIRAMTSGFGRYVNEIDFQQNNKTEVYRLIKNLAVGIIPEFDETNSSSISVLKSVITAESIELRALYKNESESVPIRTSFISASNFEDVLRDSSGNRRFMLFDISAIKHTFEMVNGDQIAAQSFELAKKKYKPSPESEAAMRDVVKKETPIASDKLFIEEVGAYLLGKYQDIYRDKTDALLGRIHAGKENIPNRLRWFQVSDNVIKIGRKYGFHAKRCQQIMVRAGFTHYDGTSSYYAPRVNDVKSSRMDVTQ